MKKIILIIFLIILAANNITFAENLNIAGESALLIDMESGQVLYERNPHLKLHPASTTKMMTGILAIELGNPDDIVTVDEEVVSLTRGSHIALEPGEKLLLKDLVYALLVESANDAANVIAIHISGSIESFVDLMNAKAKELGAENTHFVNPNGLTDEKHLTTAYDLSLIARYAMKNETFREIVSTYTYTIPTTNKKDEERYLWSTNKLLYGSSRINVDGNQVPVKYEGITGIKTGYTTEAGNCLVASAKRGNSNLMAVVLKSNGYEVFSDIHKLLNYGFEAFDSINIAVKNQYVDNFKIQNGSITEVPGILKDNLTAIIPKDSTAKVSTEIAVKENFEAPIQKGQVIGKVDYYLEDQLLGSCDIISTMNIEKTSPSIFQILVSKWYLFLIVGLAIIVKVKKASRKSRRKSNSVFY